MTRYFIGIGSNENAQENCQLMISALREEFGDIRLSRIIQTEAYGLKAPDYLNAVACIETEMDNETLNRWCKIQEQLLGRDRQNTLCSADLDILLVVDAGEPVDPALAEDEYFRPLIAELEKELSQ